MVINYSSVFIRNFLRFSYGRKGDGKTGLFIQALDADRTVMQFHDPFGDGQPQTGAAAARIAGKVQTIELFKYPVQLFFGNGLAGICKGDSYLVLYLRSLDMDRRIFKAKDDCVSQQVVKYPLEFIRVTPELQILRRFQTASKSSSEATTLP